MDKPKSTFDSVPLNEVLLPKSKEICNMNESGGLLYILTYKTSIKGHVERYQPFIEWTYKSALYIDILSL